MRERVEGTDYGRALVRISVSKLLCWILNMKIKQLKSSLIFWALGSFFLVQVACSTEQPPNPLNYPDADSSAAKLFLKRCGDCHAPPLPNSRIAALWPSILDRMQLQMTAKKVMPLSKEETQSILNYLQSNAQKRP